MFRKAIFYLFFSSLPFSLFAQEGDPNIEASRQIVAIANEAYFNTKAIILANEQYAQAAMLDPNNIEANYMAGFTFLQTIYKSQSASYLEKVYEIDPEYKFNILFMIGQGYQYGLDFEKAISYFNKYLSKLQNQSSYRGEDYTPVAEVNKRIKECENGIFFVKNAKPYKIENLGSAINSEWPDYGPVLNADETILVFTSRRGDGNLNEDVFDDLLYYEDVFYSTRPRSGNWVYSQNIGESVNGPFHNSNLAISADGKELYTYKDVNKGDIYLSVFLDDGTWSEPEALGKTINSSFSENSMSISPDGSTIFFSSDRPTSKGGLDIFVAKRDGKGNWGAATNLSDKINTEFDDDGPFLDYDGKTLYFSSRGHEGIGGFDIYRSTYDSALGEWSTPVNLGYPMNTPDNDIYFVSSKEPNKGYYASAREDGQGFTDIYKIDLVPFDDSEHRIPDEPIAEATEPVEEKPVIEEEPEVEETIIEEKPEPVKVVLKPVTLLLRVEDKNTGGVISDAQVQILGPSGPERVISLGKGVYQAQFINESKSNYSVKVEKSGYMYKVSNFAIPAATGNPLELRRRITMDVIQKGYTKILRNIYYDYNTASLKAESLSELQNVRKVIMQNPNNKIEIAGHTDSFGPNDYNQWLSERRAQVVVDYLLKTGVNPQKIVAKGYGESEPIASNDDEMEGRELNRRVEFRVIE